MKKNKKILRNLLIIAIIIYIAFVFINQQKTLINIVKIRKN